MSPTTCWYRCPAAFQTAPTFWVDNISGTQYQIASQTPQFRLQSLNDLGNTPLSGGIDGSSQILSKSRRFPSQRRALPW